MNQITNLFPKDWRNLHFILLVFFSLLLIIGGSTISSPVSRGILNSLYFPFFEVKNLMVRVGTVATENDLLRQDLVEVTTKVAILEEAARENERLRSILGFDPPAGYSLLPAKVISVSYEGPLPVSAVINRGAQDFVAIDQPVVNQQGLIGRIREIMNDVSVVQLLTDPSNRVAARIAESREMGIVKYQATEGLILDNFPIQGTIHEGDVIVSSGLGGVYVSGLLVGSVEEVKRLADEPFCEVRLSPAANFNSVEELFVLRTVIE